MSKLDPNLIHMYPCWLQREAFIDSLPQDFPSMRLRAVSRSEMDAIAEMTYPYRIGWEVHENSPHGRKMCACYPKPKPVSREN